MRMKIYSCLFAFVLGCKVTAEILQKVVQEKDSVFLPCSHRVEGNVKWSRETEGSKVDILTVTGDGDKKHIKDPGKRYGSAVDGTLYIFGANVSDSGKYFCNNEAAVELTVIPSGTNKSDAEEGTSITLTCPPDVRGSHDPTWTRRIAGELQQISTVGKTLTITKLQPRDSGLYYCDGKPAVYLNVTTASPHLWQMWVRAAFGVLYLVTMISITAVTWRKAEQKQKRRRLN